MTKLVVIEGLDGSGKATQAKKLTEFFNSSYGCFKRSSKYITFPNYDSKSSEMVKMYLKGELGTNPDDVNPYVASTFFSIDRYLTFNEMGDDYYKNSFVVSDRYTTSNIIYQCAKMHKDNWKSYIHWLLDFEYIKLGLPKPDKVIYLYVPIKVSQKLMSERYSGDEGKKDIHEKNLGYLKRCQEVANYCVDNLQWIKIDCTKDGQLLSIDQIHELIKEAVLDN